MFAAHRLNCRTAHVIHFAFAMLLASATGDLAAAQVDPQRVAASGITHLSGTYVDLYTDLRDAEVQADLVALFDAAVPQWCRYFSIEPASAATYRISLSVMTDRDRFERADLLPDGLPNFPAALNRGDDIWVYVQDDDYYTRHLVLHEGTHAFMQKFLGGLGSSWYAEGMAEMIGVHRWSDGQLTLNYRLTDRRKSEGWGRPKILREQFSQQQMRSITEVIATDGITFSDVESYAWAWAACEFLSQHPLSRDAFADLTQQVTRSPGDFNQKFLATISPQLSTLNRDWRLLIGEMDYGYLVEPASAIDAEIVEPIDADGQTTHVVIDSGRSWQRVPGFQVVRGQSYRVRSHGQFVVGHTVTTDTAGVSVSQPWPCEPNGITLEYYRGRPLGEVHGWIEPDAGTGDAGLVEPISIPIPIGYEHEFVAETTGLLNLRINESPARIGDNKGSVAISLEKIE